jgi:hypothetical protein
MEQKNEMTGECQTAKQLMEKIGLKNQRSCAYGTSRAILNNLDKPLVAYALGFGGFVAIFENGHGYPKGVGFSAKNAWGNDPFGGFNEMNVDKTEKILRDTSLPAIRMVDEERLAKLKAKEQLIQPTLAEFKIKKDENLPWEVEKTYKIRKFKNGKLFAEHVEKTWGGSQVSLQNAIDNYTIAKRGWEMGYNNKKVKVKLISSTMTEDVLNKIGMQIAINAI